MEKNNVIMFLVVGSVFILLSIFHIYIIYPSIILNNKLKKKDKTILKGVGVSTLVVGLIFLIIGLVHIKDLEKD